MIAIGHGSSHAITITFTDLALKGKRHPSTTRLRVGPRSANPAAINGFFSEPAETETAETETAETVTLLTEAFESCSCSADIFETYNTTGSTDRQGKRERLKSTTREKPMEHSLHSAPAFSVALATYSVQRRDLVFLFLCSKYIKTNPWFNSGSSM